MASVYPLVSADATTEPPSVLWRADDQQLQKQPQTAAPYSTSSSSSNTAAQPINGARPILHKARSRHFDTFQNSSIIANSSSYPTVQQQQQQPQQTYDTTQFDQYPVSNNVFADMTRFETQRYHHDPSNRLSMYAAAPAYDPIHIASQQQQQQQQPVWNPMSMNLRAPANNYQWMEPSPPLLSNDFQTVPRLAQPVYPPPGSISPTRSDTMPYFNAVPTYTSPTESDDYIPNAIVIKNIPFSAQVDDMNMLFKELGLELPYAFNYHFDNGVFRGLAFANFRNTTDTAKAIAVLNGYEYCGRKLRAEYKKMLPKEERDRAEFQKRVRRGQLEEQHRQQQQREQQGFAPISAPAQNSMSGMKEKLNVNMNDAGVRRMYDQILFFTERNDPLEELNFENLPQTLRRAVHSIAFYFKHGHISSSDGERVIIYKRGNPKFQNKAVITQMLNQQQGIAADDDDMNPLRSGVYAPLPQNPTSTASALLDYLPQQPTATTQKPRSPVRSLRNTKSFADIRSSSRAGAMYSHQNSSSSSISSAYNNHRNSTVVPAMPDMASVLARMSLADIRLTARQQLASEQTASVESAVRQTQQQTQQAQQKQQAQQQQSQQQAQQSHFNIGIQNDILLE